jgi:hypothetical protein
LIQEEVKRRLNSGNACYYLVQNLLFFVSAVENVKIGIYKAIILPVFENRVLRRIFGAKREEVTGKWRK